MADLDRNTYASCFVPSGTEVTVMSGASLAVATNYPPGPAKNEDLITGNEVQNRLMMRMFGWNDPFYIKGSDLEAQVDITCGGNGAYAPMTGATGIYDVVKSTVALPGGELTTGVIRAGQPGTTQTEAIYNTYVYNPVTGVTDQYGNTKTGFQFQRGDRDFAITGHLDTVENTFGFQSIHFPQIQENARGIYNTNFDFLKGTESSGARGWTLTYWMLSQWFTGCAWNSDTTLGDECSGQGPGCDLNWESSTNMKCLNAQWPEGDYIYQPWTLGNTNNRQFGLMQKWESTDHPAKFYASSSDYIYANTVRNPPNHWEFGAHTGLWTFWAISYDGTAVSEDDDGIVDSMFVAVGVPTGSGDYANPTDRGDGAGANNFTMWSGAGGGIMASDALEVNGGNLPDRGRAGDVGIIGLAGTYAVSLGLRPQTNGKPQNKNAYWPGMLHDFRLYSGQLSTGDVKSIYLGSGRF